MWSFKTKRVLICEIVIIITLFSRFVVQCDPLTGAGNTENLRIPITQCMPANSPFTFPYPRDYEKHFEQCIGEIAEKRKLLSHPDQDKRTPEVIRSYNYDLMTYDEVTTEDGYILTVFRIPGGPKSPPAFGKPAVLLHHGLLTASDNWVLQYGDRNLAFKLVDAGYDVWLANARGTDFSQRHTEHSVPNGAYWQFGFHEIAIYDIPAIIDVMLNETGNNDIFYIGHSMGATVYAIALSEIPELNKKIRAGFMLAPAIHLGHAYNPLRKLTSIVGTPIQDIVYYFLKGHFNGGTNKFLELMGLSPGDVCTPSAFRCKVCENLIFFMFGFNAPQTNYTNLPNVMSKIRNTASLRTVIHFAQNLLSCEFRKYDYGMAGNWAAYGSLHPPSYDLHGVTAPTYIFYGESDNFIPVVDVETTKDAMLPETIRGMYKVEFSLFNHIDFVMARDADKLVYNKILEIMELYV